MSNTPFSANTPVATQPIRSLYFWWSLAGVILVIDQLSKWAIIHRFALHDSITVTSFFNLVRVHNEGAAFSFLADAGGWQRWLLCGIAVAAVIFMGWMLRGARGNTAMSLALSLVVGGAMGNLIDRLLFGYVVDFLQFHWSLLEPLFKGGYFPSFNVADSAITVGAILLIGVELLGPKPSTS